MRLSSRRVFVVIGAAALMVAAAAFAATARGAQSYVVSGNVIGGFKTATEGYRRANQLFGGPYSSTQDRNTCIVRWANGLVVTFKRKQPYAAFAKACISVQSARINGTRWRTDKGLRVGSAGSQIKRSYPQAAKRMLAGTTMWVLVPGLEPALAAKIKNGKVQYLSVVRLRVS